MSTRSKIAAQLEKVGGTPPKSQDPFDAVLHEYLAASMGESYFRKRKQIAKTAMMSQITPVNQQKLDQTIAEVADTKITQTIELQFAENYALQTQVKTGATYVDTNALKVELLKKMSTQDVEKLFDIVTKQRDPALVHSIIDTE